jgi:hypothetical protein
VTESPRRIAMWSGPRNLSTALMYAFGNRTDCACWDEPFYAFYLNQSGIDHPLREQVMAAGETDFAGVVARCLGPVPGAKPVFYQKHMTHHMLPGFDRSWTFRLSNAFLIRAPERVLASYARKREDVTLRDIGFIQQREIFEQLADHLGTAPPVIDADDILADPRRALSRLCAALAIPFSEAMLCWPAGPRAFDGVWARHWYEAAWRSTGFAAAPGPAPVLPGHLRRLAEAARPCYEHLRRFSLKPDG